MTISEATTKIVLITEYDGTCYHGFQFQLDQPTVQAEIEKALLKLTGESVRVLAASRTDTGVHARGQIVSFRTRSSLAVDSFVSGLNYYLPEDIAVKAAYKVDNSFDIRRNAVSREYNYYMLESPTRSPLRERFCYRVPRQLNTEIMNQGCQVLTGRHDFASFASRLAGTSLKSTVRSVYEAKVARSEELTIFSMVANSFLPHQIRNTVGALIRVGLGVVPVDEFRSIMDAKKPGLAGPTVPACGLFLIKINYSYPFGEKLNENN